MVLKLQYCISVREEPFQAVGFSWWLSLWLNISFRKTLVPLNGIEAIAIEEGNYFKLFVFPDGFHSE
jgi:hypothetical protein